MSLYKYSVEEISEIEKSYNELIKSISSTMTVEEVMYVKKAYELCCFAYDGMRMNSGRPVLLHVIDVAQISYSELGLRSKTVVSALLHNIMNWTNTTTEELRSKFGDRVAIIIEGLSKVMALDMSKISMKSDAFRKLFLSIIDDIRVVMLIIAHCLYNCRNQDDIDGDVIFGATESHELSNKNKKKFFENIKYLIIPIVHRLGLYNVKREFEEAVMMYENPVEYKEIEDKITISRVTQEEKMASFLQPIRRALSLNGIETTIKWRTKSIPSIFAKMKAQGVPFEEVYDLFAVRIIITNSSLESEKDDCWRVYSLVDSLYKTVPERLRDWITKPKASGYESLHTTVDIGVNFVEVQIRTQRMDDVAEKGAASHWAYKSGKEKHQTADEWLNKIRDILEDPYSSHYNAFDSSRAEKVKSNNIYLITPQGDVRQLPIGATILDFAYDIHTQVGSHCIGARVNGKMQPIRHVLDNGDRVEILTSTKQVPKIDWLDYVTTEKAKSKIKRYLKDLEMKEAELGSSIFHRKLKNWKISYTDRIFTELLKKYDCSSGIEFYHKIATEEINMLEMKSFLLSLFEDRKERTSRTDDEAFVCEKKKDETLVIGGNINFFSYKMAKCCNPHKGDNITGFVSVTNGITVHKDGCPNAAALKRRCPDRFLDVSWKSEAVEKTVAVE